jgi:hypothetical protein
MGTAADALRLSPTLRCWLYLFVFVEVLTLSRTRATVRQLGAAEALRAYAEGMTPQRLGWMWVERSSRVALKNNECGAGLARLIRTEAYRYRLDDGPCLWHLSDHELAEACTDLTGLVVTGGRDTKARREVQRKTALRLTGMVRADRSVRLRERWGHQRPAQAGRRHARQSRPTATRTRGSRRVTARCTGPPGDDDPGGESEPPGLVLSGWRSRPDADCGAVR